MESAATDTMEFTAPLPWQVAQWTQLWQQHTTDQLAHAYLLCGDSGLGKSLFARDFARALLCQSPVEGSACNECDSCLSGGLHQHPDLMWVAPEEGARGIKIEQIRALTHFISRTSHSGGKKLAVIDQAHLMNQASANAILKTLEEPAGHTTLMLVSDIPGMLAPTVRSRCQRVQFAAPSLDVTVTWLQSRLPNIPAKPLAQAAGSRPLLALAMAGDDRLERRQQFVSKLGGLWQRRVTVQALSNEALKLEDEQSLEYLSVTSTMLVKALLRESADPDAAEFAEAEELLAILRQLPAPDTTLARRLLRFSEAVSLARKQLRSGANPNLQLIVESLLLQWQGIPQH